MSSFIDFTHKLFQKKIFNNATINYEQKGETMEELGKGKHFHAICNLRYSSKGISWHITEILRLAKKNKWEDYILNQSIDLKKIKTTEDMNRLKNYTNTKEFGKHNIAKLKSWEHDKPWRERYGLNDTYTILDIVPSKQAHWTMEQYIEISTHTRGDEHLRP